ncbi:MAG: putative ABC transporter ATP-binding protein YxlF [candidate division WS6 bacterium OLB20]|uniref:Putative ABC transporter ATP-binding protein YxlF n=1 Tax=candidate division WS6 bacterium OLB20 TaxID=1617426 RepID=A0A136LXU9_9BACT|nr:MAG: putative ABC transporter ATP-binding protein YxlF [candidate division WS6 bacterium OLB20]
MKKIIEIKDFTKSFGSQTAVDNLSFDVYEGDIFAFLGSNGSGKTTTIRCLLDIYTPDSGTLHLFGRPYEFSMSKDIGYLPEERGIYTRSRVIDLFVYFGNLRGISTKDALDNAHQYLERVGLIEHKDKQVSQLSSGMQQKVQVGLALQHHPRLLLLDEPFKGLDPLNRQLFIEMFKELKEQGVTIVYSTHVIDEAQRLTDRLVIINDGKRKAYGTTEEVRKTHGSEHIHLEFTGKFPKRSELYTSVSTTKTAEIIPNKGVDPEEILQELLASDLRIISFRIDLPSLNEVFIALSKDE